MPGNRRQKEAVALALTRQGRLEVATPTLVVEVMSAGDWEEVLTLLCDHLPATDAEEALPEVCKAAGIAFAP